MSHGSAKGVDVNRAVIEALATLAKLLGCAEAAVFLDGRRSDLKTILGKRWRRAGFTWSPFLPNGNAVHLAAAQRGAG